MFSNHSGGEEERREGKHLFQLARGTIQRNIQHSLAEELKKKNHLLWLLLGKFVFPIIVGENLTRLGKRVKNVLQHEDEHEDPGLVTLV